MFAIADKSEVELWNSHRGYISPAPTHSHGSMLKVFKCCFSVSLQYFLNSFYKKGYSLRKQSLLCPQRRKEVPYTGRFPWRFLPSRFCIQDVLMSPAYKVIKWTRWRITVMSGSSLRGLLTFRPMQWRSWSLVRKYFFIANHLSEQPRSLPTTLSLTHPSDGSLGSSTNFLISLTGGQAPERAPGFYAFFVFFVYPRRKP